MERLFQQAVSAFGPILWFVGLPAGTSDNQIELTFALFDKTGKEVWTHRYSGNASITQGMYYNWGSDTLNFAVLMEDGMNDCLRQLATDLPGLEQQARTLGKN